MMNKGRYREFY
jgi:histidyl-tRNA synthetase